MKPYFLLCLLYLLPAPQNHLCFGLVNSSTEMISPNTLSRKGHCEKQNVSFKVEFGLRHCLALSQRF